MGAGYGSSAVFDIDSILLASAISGLCLSLTIIVFWMANRGSAFVITWAAGVIVLVGHVMALRFYTQTGSVALGTLACTLLAVGTMCLYAASRQFADGRRPLAIILALSVPYLLVVPPVFALGYDGVALILANAATATLFVMTGLAYLRRRPEAPLSIGALAFLYAAVGISFALCGAMLLVQGAWTIGYPPANWAENLNAVVATVATTGIGALTLSLDQSRLAGRRQVEAMTDPMTGLMNRRALLAAHDAPFGARKAIVIFDIDHFKQVNDEHGHAVGDEVIRRFAQVARKNGRSGDHLVRLGGEEFVMVLDAVTPEQVRKVAERIVAGFAKTEMTNSAGAAFFCTVSAGIAFGDDHRPSLDDVLARADRALYQAKRGGRNRIETGEWRLVS